MRALEIGEITLDLLNGTPSNVTILAPGRGVQADGSLSEYSKWRVDQTLAIANLLYVFGKGVTIIWTGGASRTQVRDDTMPAVSEGEAMRRYAVTRVDSVQRFTHLSEEASLSTTENFTLSVDMFVDTLVIIVSDRLHYLCRRIQYLAHLILIGKKVLFVQIASNPDTSFKGYINEVATTILTFAFMSGVKRGDCPSINHRQALLASTVVNIGRRYQRVKARFAKILSFVVHCFKSIKKRLK